MYRDMAREWDWREGLGTEDVGSRERPCFCAEKLGSASGLGLLKEGGRWRVR